MSMTKAEAGRLGGLATVKRHGKEHMRQIGRAGFRSALDKGWGQWLAESKLGDSYRAKFGRDPAIATRQQGRPRSAPVSGLCQWPGCTAAAVESHHVDGWRHSDEQTGLCGAHHDELHRLWRDACRLWRGRDRDGGPASKPSLRSIAIAIGIGCSDLEGLR